MFRKQLLIAAGVVPAIVIVFLVYRQAHQLFGRVPLPADDAGSRIAFAARWLVLPGITLLIGVMGAARRGFIKDAIEGTRMPEHYGLEINLRYNQNTLEQVVLAVIAWVALSIALPRDDLLVIPAMASLFFFGRLAFWIGYRLHPLARSFGMVLTATPTLGAYAWLIWRAITNDCCS